MEIDNSSSKSNSSSKKVATKKIQGGCKKKTFFQKAMIELGNLYAFEGNDAEAKKWRKKANSKGCTGTNCTAGRGGRKPKTFFQKAMITLKKMF